MGKKQPKRKVRQKSAEDEALERSIKTVFTAMIEEINTDFDAFALRLRDISGPETVIGTYTRAWMNKNFSRD